MSFDITKPVPYLNSLPYTKLSIKEYFKIFSVFRNSNVLSKEEIMQMLKKIIEQSTSTISSNYLPMFKSLGLIDDEWLLTKVGQKVVANGTLKVKQNEFLFELFHRRWFVFSLFHFYSIKKSNPDITKRKLTKKIIDIFKKNGFYVKNSRGVKNTPNDHRIDGIYNLFYFTGLIDENYEIQKGNFVKFEQYFKKRVGESPERKKGTIRSFLHSIADMIIGRSSKAEKELRKESEEEIETFYERVIREYKKFNEKYVFIDDLARKFEVPNFFEKLWLMQEEGKALLVPSRKLEHHRTYTKYGRRYSKVMFVGVS